MALNDDHAPCPIFVHSELCAREECDDDCQHENTRRIVVCGACLFAEAGSDPEYVSEHVLWPCAASRQGAPRQAGTVTGDPTGQVRRDLEMLGIMTSVRLLTPASAGHAVRILVGDGHATGVLHLEPQQASDLAHQLLADAQDAIYADRAVRRG